MPATLNLLIPGLFDLPLEELPPGFVEAELPNLNRLLSLARPVANQAFSLDAMIAKVLRWQHIVGLPMAQAFVELQERKANRHMLFEAVHYKADLQGASILPIHKTLDNLNHIEVIIEDFSKFFEDDCEIKSVTSGSYLISLKKVDAPSCYPHLLSVIGKSANPYMKQLPDYLDWYKLFNEMQMYLHQHLLNQDRLAQDDLLINSFWFWGAGELPSENNIESRDELNCFCDDQLLSTFSQDMKLLTKPLSSLDELDLAKDSMVIDLKLLEALKVKSNANIGDILIQLENDIFKPLMQKLKQSTGHLNLMTGFSVNLEFKNIDRFKFWVSKKTLSDFLAY